ncbi:MAG TPA: O-antigen ligase domain-containing protein, partial [Aquaticitalea sp.]|nr:O-antigen ligase domain-containing protein [Aquaticitalea sp.]
MSYFGQIALHILIGILIYLNEGLAKIYFFVILGYFLYRITLSSHDNSKTYEVLKACAYFVGAEVFLRTARGAISYEAVKYIVMLFMLIGMLYKGLSG